MTVRILDGAIRPQWMTVGLKYIHATTIGDMLQSILRDFRYTKGRRDDCTPYAPFARGALRGHYRIAHTLLEDTKRALRSFDEAGRAEGGHEGICYWAGREEPPLTSLEAIVVPRARHRRLGVFVSEAAFGEVARHARAMALEFLPRYTVIPVMTLDIRTVMMTLSDAIRKHAVVGRTVLW